MNLVNTLRVVRLKATARKQYNAYRTRTDAFSCGSSLSEYVCLELAQLKSAFNATMDKLSAIDPTAPKARIP